MVFYYLNPNLCSVNFHLFYEVDLFIIYELKMFLKLIILKKIYNKFYEKFFF